MAFTLHTPVDKSLDITGTPFTNELIALDYARVGLISNAVFSWYHGDKCLDYNPIPSDTMIPHYANDPNEFKNYLRMVAAYLATFDL
jgi:hypothetical protein